MAYTIELKTITDERGSLTVIEKEVPFQIKRVYYVYNMPGDASRGRHGHLREKSALICLAGSCIVRVYDPEEHFFALDRPDLCLILLPKEWHEVTVSSEHSIVLALSSEYYNPDDYFREKPA